MQDKYVCDIGDFGKFFLFRKIFSNSKKLAIVWFYHNIKENNSDGNYINYFHRVESLDRELESSFKKLLKSKERNIKTLQSLNLLNNCSYFDTKISKNRELWFKNALTFAKEYKIVSVAPDNGIAIKCNKKEKTLAIVDNYKDKQNSHKYILKMR